MVENLLLVGAGLIAFLWGLRLIYLGAKASSSPYLLTKSEKFNREMNLLKGFLSVTLIVWVMWKVVRGEPEWFLVLVVALLGFLVLSTFIFSRTRTPLQIGIVALVFLIIPLEVVKKLVVHKMTVKEVVSLVENGRPVECGGVLVREPTLRKVNGKVYVRTGNGQLVKVDECRKPRNSLGK